MTDRLATAPVPRLGPQIGLLRPAFDRLAEIAKLDEDWDTYDGLPPARLAVASAGQSIISVAERLSDTVGKAGAPYAVMPFPDCGVQVTGRHQAGELQVDVGPTGSFGCLRIDRDGAQCNATEADHVPFPDITARSNNSCVEGRRTGDGPGYCS